MAGGALFLPVTVCTVTLLFGFTTARYGNEALSGLPQAR